MYEMLLTYDDVIDPEVLDDIMTLLSDTNWLVVPLDAVTKYCFSVKGFLVLVVCVTRCRAGCLLQGEWPCHSEDPEESALWLVGSPQAAGSYQGNQDLCRQMMPTANICWTELTPDCLSPAEPSPGFLIILRQQQQVAYLDQMLWELGMMCSSQADCCHFSLHISQKTTTHWINHKSNRLHNMWWKPRLLLLKVLACARPNISTDLVLTAVN